MSAQGGADPVLHAIVRAAADATSAADAWLAAHDEGSDELVVVAAAGRTGTALRGREVPGTTGSAGYVLASGQPLALAEAGDDPRFAEGLVAMLGRRPRSLVCVPCEVDDDVLAVLELVDKEGDGPFSYQDLQIAHLFGSVAAVALRFGAGGPSLIPSPAELREHLAALERTDVVRYAYVAELISVLLSDD